MAKKTSRYQYDFNVIYNNAASNLAKTDDTITSLEFTKKFVHMMERSFLKKAYYVDRDALPGKNKFIELFRVLGSSKWTFVIFTKGFTKNCWSIYCQQASFMNYIEEHKGDRLIPIAVGVREIQPELNINYKASFGESKDEWDSSDAKSEWDKLVRLLHEERDQVVTQEVTSKRLQPATQNKERLVRVSEAVVTAPSGSAFSTASSSQGVDLSAAVPTGPTVSVPRGPSPIPASEQPTGSQEEPHTITQTSSSQQLAQLQQVIPDQPQAVGEGAETSATAPLSLQEDGVDSLTEATIDSAAAVTANKPDITVREKFSAPQSTVLASRNHAIGPQNDDVSTVAETSRSPNPALASQNGTAPRNTENIQDRVDSSEVESITTVFAGVDFRADTDLSMDQASLPLQPGKKTASDRFSDSGYSSPGDSIRSTISEFASRSDGKQSEVRTELSVGQVSGDIPGESAVGDNVASLSAAGDNVAASLNDTDKSGQVARENTRMGPQGEEANTEDDANCMIQEAPIEKVQVSKKLQAVKPITKNEIEESVPASRQTSTPTSSSAHAKDYDQEPSSLTKKMLRLALRWYFEPECAFSGLE